MTDHIKCWYFTDEH